MTMPGREPSLGELADDIHEMRADVHALRGVLERTYLRLDVYEAHRQARDTRLAALEARAMRATQYAIGGLLMPILAAVVVYLLIGGR